MPTPIETNTASLQSLLAAVQALPSAPSGSTQITANGTYNISQYASAVVAIPVYDGTVV